MRDIFGLVRRELSYHELASRVQSLATQLQELGVGPGTRIPLVVKRGMEMVVGIWAVLSCGAQYVPLDGGVVPESTIRTDSRTSTKWLNLLVAVNLVMTILIRQDLVIC